MPWESQHRAARHEVMPSGPHCLQRHTKALLVPSTCYMCTPCVGSNCVHSPHTAPPSVTRTGAHMWGNNGKKPAAAHTTCMFSLLGFHATLYRVGKHVGGGRSREGSLFAPWCYRMGPDISQCMSVSWKCRKPHGHNKQRTNHCATVATVGDH